MSDDNDNLMSCADGDHVLESKDDRRLRKNREKAKKYRKANPHPRSSLNSDELERRRTQGRVSMRRSREKKKQITAAKIEAQRHAGNIDTQTVDLVGDINEASGDIHDVAAMDIDDNEASGDGHTDMDIDDVYGGAAGGNDGANNEDAAGLAASGVLDNDDGNENVPVAQQVNIDCGQDWCDNCMRRQIRDVDVESPYYLHFNQVSSVELGKRSSCLKMVGKNTTNPVTYTLCLECHKYTKSSHLMTPNEKRHRSDWKYSWPSFLWNLLSGRDRSTGIPFHETYKGWELWKFIPTSIRGYWVDIIKDIRYKSVRSVIDGVEEQVLVSVLENHPNNSIDYDTDGGAYGDCDMAVPEPYFVDRTEQVKHFEDEVKKFDLKSLLDVLDPSRSTDSSATPNILPNVLCPWGCTEFCHRSAHANFGQLIQHHLRKVELNFPSGKYVKELYLIETSRNDYLRDSLEDYDTVLMNDKWKVRPTVELVDGKGLSIMVCRYHEKRGTKKRLQLHIPRKPNNNLSSERSDDLCHAKVKPRGFVPMQANKFCSSMCMINQEASYAGVNSCNITTEGGFTRTSIMLLESESLSIAGRGDINQLVSNYVSEGKMTEDLAENLREHSKRRYPDGSLDKFISGSTYVPLNDSMILQTNPPKCTVPCVVQRRGLDNMMEEVNIILPRSWLPTINFIQTEDNTGYGTVMKATSNYPGQGKAATMMQWALAGIIVGCKELHCAIDQKSRPFHYNDWAGHVLAHLHGHCMKSDDIAAPSGSPFKPGRKSDNTFVRTKIEMSMPNDMKNFIRSPAGDDIDQPVWTSWNQEMKSLYFRYNLQYWKNLFPQNDYTTISIHGYLELFSGNQQQDQTIEPPNPNFAGVDADKTNVIIVIGNTDTPPRENLDRNAKPGRILVGGFEYEARVIVCIDEPDPGGVIRQSTFSGRRYTRQGAGFPNWYHQRRGHRAPELMTKCGVSDSCEEGANVDFPSDLPTVGFSFVTVYVKIKTYTADQFRLEFHKTLGGQTHAYCSCSENPFPLIVTGRRSEKKPNPNDVQEDAQHFSNVNSDNIKRKCMRCDKTERYVCSRSNCKTRICENCFKNLPTGRHTYFTPPSENGDTGNVDVGAGIDALHIESDYDSEEDEDYETGDSVRDEEYDVGSLSSEDDTSLPDLDAREEESLPDDESIEDLEDGDGSVDSEEEENTQHDYGERQTLRERILNLRDDDDDDDDDVDDDDNNGVVRRDDEEFVLDDFLTTSPYNEIDANEDEAVPLSNAVPVSDAGDFAHTVLDRGAQSESYVPVHVLFNQGGTLLTRFNKRITGTQVQQNFMQTLVSGIAGVSIPLLYLMAACFPRHFYCSATHDPCSILGAPPLSCYSRSANPHGFASTLSTARTLGTHSSSSTSTCPLFWSFCYDIQANKAAGGIDSRLVSRSGFIVDVKSKHGISTREDSNSPLSQSVDSHQSALDLAASQPFVPWHWFLTFTCSQATHPGMSHLFAHKKSKSWTKHFPGYEELSESSKAEVDRSFELAYGSVIGRCWMEVRKLWLEYITFSTASILGKVAHVFFRDEYQEKSGNLSHIHGLVALDQGDMENEEFKEFIYNLQKCSVGDLFPADEIDKYIEDGLFKDENDWHTLTGLGGVMLPHRHTARCLRRVADNNTPEDFRCRKIHSVSGKDNPLEHELKVLKFEFSPACLRVLKESGLWDPPTEEHPNGVFRCDLLQPKRHMGAVNPAATCNMSPVIPQFFAATKSQQNAQILHGTNGVARYVVKYVVKLDEGNRVTVWADSKRGDVIRAEHQFLHNTKVTSSKINEEKAFEKSRAHEKPPGRAIAFPEIQQQILGYPEVMTTLVYTRISTKPFELRNATKIKLNNQGHVELPEVSDFHERGSPSQKARERMNEDGLEMNRFLTESQEILFRNKNSSYDKITEFSLRPVELMELFAKVGQYFRWFNVDSDSEIVGDIYAGLSVDIRQCCWYDGIGRRVRLRLRALEEVKMHLETLSEETISVDSWILRETLLIICNHNESESDRQLFIYDDSTEHDLPIPVYSSVTPHNAVEFLVHMMLMLGEFETELDLQMQGSMRESLAMAKLIDDDFSNEQSMARQINNLVNLVVCEVFYVQPVSLRKLDDYIVMSRRLFDSVILRDEIPINDIPSCILTDMLDNKEMSLQDFARDKRNDQLTSICRALPAGLNIPSQADVLACTKDQPINWDPVASFVKFSEQSDESFAEQLLAVTIGVRSIMRYSQQFGPNAVTFNKGNVVHGAPGSGKSYVIQYLSLYAMSQGLRLMTTTLMGVRANALGGIHWHRLFGVKPQGPANPFRQAEIALEKLDRKTNITLLHVIKTMDVLVIDECGQFSAQQLSILDIILRKARRSDIPFGGVLIFGTMDHTQLGAIKGWPFLLSSHILTDFNLIKLSHSVRAHSDRNFQRIQELTRMSPKKLMSNIAFKEEFIRLFQSSFSFAPNFDHESITSNVQCMYARRMPAFEAASRYVNRCESQFNIDGTPYILNIAVDMQRIVHTHYDFSEATSDFMITALNHGAKEPKKLLFFEGALFEATLNGDGFNQSQLMLMVDLPTADMVGSKSPIKLYAAPPGVNYIDLTDGIPSVHVLVNDGWTEVSVGHCPEHHITQRGLVGYRQQYALRHIGSSTINKQLGNTIIGKCAIECTPDCCPWEKAQVVVGLSRTRRAQDTIIVGPPDFAANKMWDLITVSNQWTSYIEDLLDKLSIGGDANHVADQTFRYADRFPYRTCDIILPTDRSGYVYFLVSVRDFDRDYVGQTMNIAKRLRQHNSGRGARATADPFFRPYCVAAYICGLSHMDKNQREDLEFQWKLYNRQAMQEGRTDIQARIEQGRRVVQGYNAHCAEEERIRFVVTIEKSTINASALVDR